MDNNLLLKQLLGDIPEITKQQYKSYLQLHIKEMLMRVSKQQIEDTLPIKKKYYSCKLKCYNKLNYQDFDKTKIPVLEYCLNKCKQPITDLNRFLDNINFLSKKKFVNCSKHCTEFSKLQDPIVFYNSCYWGCYNRLDKRYIKYWLDQKNALIYRYSDVLE